MGIACGKKVKSLLFWLGLGGIIVMIFFFILPKVEQNGASLVALRAAFNDSPELRINAVDLLKNRAIQDCHANWLLGRMLPQGENRDAFLRALQCSPNYLALLTSAYPTDLELAQQAVDQIPQNSAIWFWLADAQEAAKLPSTADSYRQVVTLDPNNALAWCRFGVVSQKAKDFESALMSFSKCCDIGDAKNYDGCYGAGQVLEQLGDIPQAILYYRRATYPPSLQRADQLQSQINP